MALMSSCCRWTAKPLTLMDGYRRYAERRRRHSTMRALAGPNVSIYEHQVAHDRVEPFPVGQTRTAFSRSWSKRITPTFRRT